MIAPRLVLAGGFELALDRPRLLAIVNLTPDSFSDGGALRDTAHALDFMRRCVSEGADMLDVGGESTRPGSARVPADEQIRRVIPAIEAARAAGLTAPISIDTTSAAVARAALDAGASAINDVSGGEEDPQMLALAAERRAGLILMHRRLDPAAGPGVSAYPSDPDYPAAEGGVVGVVRHALARLAQAALDAGVPRGCIVLDPGLGFGKSAQQNFELVARTRELASIGFPVLSAASRKRFIGWATDEPEASRRGPGSLAISVAHALQGVRLFRVHDVAAHAQALRVAHQVVRHQRA